MKHTFRFQQGINERRVYKPGVGYVTAEPAYTAHVVVAVDITKLAKMVEKASRSKRLRSVSASGGIVVNIERKNP